MHISPKNTIRLSDLWFAAGIFDRIESHWSVDLLSVVLRILFVLEDWRESPKRLIQPGCLDGLAGPSLMAAGKRQRQPVQSMAFLRSDCVD